MNTQKDNISQSENSTDTQKRHSLILYNDDYHTFDYVIQALIDVCNHDPLQAAQCTYLVHFKDKCDVKSGSHQSLRPLRAALSERDLKAVIE